MRENGHPAAAPDRHDGGVRALSPVSVRWTAVGALIVFVACMTLSVLNLPFDHALARYVNGFSQRSFLLDHAIGALNRPVFSSAVLVAMLWWVWFESADRTRRAGILLGVAASCVASLLSRTLQIALPTHVRPLQNASLGFLRPDSVLPGTLRDWSSFPSDHASLLFGLAMVVYMTNRRLGFAGMVLALVVNIGRVFMGLHFPLDILGGEALGVFLVMLSYPLRHREGVQGWVGTRTGTPLFYAVAFYVSFSLATLFQEFREVGAGVAHAVRGHYSHNL